MRRLAILLLTSAALPLAFFGAEPQRTSPSPLARVPDRAHALVNPFAGDTDAALGGRKVYERNCARCHEENKRGQRRGPALAQQVSSASAGAVFWVIKHGNRSQGMPSWGELPEQQIWQIVGYLKTRKTE